MKYLPIDKALFVANRKFFVKELQPSSLAIFNSNDTYPTSADGTLAFKQHADIFYLSGVDQEESVLILFPDAPDEKHREILFLRETNKKIAIWEGEKLTKERALEVAGIKTVYWLQELPVILNDLMTYAKNVYINTNEHLRATIDVETREARFIKTLTAKYPAHNYSRSAPIMHHIRAIKSDLEVALIKQACNITEKGFRKVLQMVKPNVTEYEIEAEFISEFIRNRSNGFAYTPIIASGFNACVLHYIQNNQTCRAGDVILMDVAAEYANYASDMTRCVPVSGNFTNRQRQVYNAVLNVMKQATNMLRPGTILGEYQEEVGKIMQSELISLGLLDKADVAKQDSANPLYRKYFMHGISHYMGLDVHDVGPWNKPMQPGMVFTCEPGIYIREENLGIRLENDILVTENNPVDLMARIPLEANDIESLMNDTISA